MRCEGGVAPGFSRSPSRGDDVVRQSRYDAHAFSKSICYRRERSDCSGGKIKHSAALCQCPERAAQHVPSGSMSAPVLAIKVCVLPLTVLPPVLASIPQVMVFATITLVSILDCNLVRGQGSGGTAPLSGQELRRQMDANNEYLNLRDCTINCNDLVYILHVAGKPGQSAPFVSLDNVTVAGTVILLGEGSETVIPGTLKCTNCRFQGGVSVMKCLVPNGFTFERCQFPETGFSAKSSNFNELNFTNCTLSAISLDGGKSDSVLLTHCGSSVSIVNVEFTGYFRVSEMISDWISCSQSKFHDSVSFQGSANLPDLDVLALEKAEDLEEALEQFAAIAEDLKPS